MAKGKKRGLFTGNKPIGGPAMKSRRVARRVTSQYHTLMTEKAKLSHDSKISKEEKQLKLSEIEEKLNKIEEKDFFEVLPERAYDIVVCSMVINCVTDSQKRGEMIARLFMHLQPNPQSLLFLILPRRCLSSPFFAPPSSSSSSSPDGSSAFAHMLQDVFGFKVAFFVLSLPTPSTIVPSSPSLEWTEIMRESISSNVLNLTDATSPSLVQLYKRVCGIAPSSLPNDLKEGKSETFIINLDASVFLSNQASRRLADYI
eukprot:gene28540-34452_t